MLEARVFNQSPTLAARRQLWFGALCYAFCQVSVMGGDFMQSGDTWGNLKYGSTNPAWKNVPWTNMAEAGCGPTSLANVIDYLLRLFATGEQKGTSPAVTMQYTSRYGRVAAPPAGGGTPLPQGTSGDIMMANLDKQWPGYAGEELKSVDDAISGCVPARR